jgi:predicted Rossmann fold flavoprotein
MNLLEAEGLQLKVERGGRVFPVSDKARDVIDTMKRFAEEKGVKIWLNSAVENILTENGAVKGVKLKNGNILEAASVIVATGGASYPRTGSTGDGYVMAGKLGHTVTPLKPSLIPLLTAGKTAGELQGLSLRNISITIMDKKGRKVYGDFGEMLFTHFGVTGPVILSASRHILPYGYKDVKLVIDLKPALDEETLDSRIRRDFEQFSRKQFKNSLDELLPQKMIPVIIELSGIPEDKPVNQITKEERHKIVELLKNFTLEITGSRPISEAIVTAGGVRTSEINPSTMESKLVKGLFFAGEIIDVDAYTGGFNLTIAFSTGCLAGMNC